MSSIWKERPSPGEYGSFYQTYLDKLGEESILEILRNQQTIVCDLIDGLSPEQELHTYSDEKWTVKEVIGHLIDTERVFAYRALSISRNDTHKLPGFDQDEYVEAAHFNERSLAGLKAEYEGQRNSVIAFFKALPEVTLSRTGIANDYSLSVRAIPFIIGGHERHHLQILDSKYGLEVWGE